MANYTYLQVDYFGKVRTRLYFVRYSTDTKGNRKVYQKSFIVSGTITEWGEAIQKKGKYKRDMSYAYTKRFYSVDTR